MRRDKDAVEMRRVVAASGVAVGSAVVIDLAVERAARGGEPDSKPAVLGAEPPDDSSATAGCERLVPGLPEGVNGEAIGERRAAVAGERSRIAERLARAYTPAAVRAALAQTAESARRACTPVVRAEI